MRFCLSMKNILLIFLIFFHFNLIAQSPTIIRGRITDASTNEPIAFVNISLKNLKLYTTTDFDGKYEIKTTLPADSIIAQFVGYYRIAKPLKKHITQNIDFHMKSSVNQLNEVVVTPSEEPVMKIMRQVWDNKKRHNMDWLDAYQCENYSKVQVYLRRLLKKRRDKNLLDTSKVVDKLSIATGENDIPAIPVYMTESMSDVYFISQPEREKMIVKASKTQSLAGIETDLILQLTGKNSKYNFNDNWIKILDKNFVSPIAKGGSFYYKYYLKDTVVIDGSYCYEIRVKPKRKQDLAFNGTIWINDTSFALKRISVEVGKEANLNFVERIKIQQDMIPTTTDAWMPFKTRVLADAVNIFISIYTINTNIVVNKPQPVSFFNNDIEIADSSDKVKETFWEGHRPATLTGTDSLSDKNISALRKVPRLRFLASLASTAIKGFYTLGGVELGPWIMVYNKNKVEGDRIRLGMKTNSVFSKKWIFRGYLAYGFKDALMKYNIQTEHFFSRRTWTKAGFQYSEDVENVGAMDLFYSNSTFLTYASSFGGSDKINRIKISRVWFESDLFKGFTAKMIFLNKYFLPASNDYFFEYYTDKTKTLTRRDFTISQITFLAIYQPKATFIIDKNERFPVSIQKSPMLTLDYTIGFKNVFNSNFSYSKISIGIKHRFNMAGLGYVNYDLKATKTFSSLPYPLLNTLAGNQSIFRTDNTYNLMRYGEFVSDQTIEFFYSYRLDGLILDKLPLLKKLNLRMVTTGHFAFGSFDEKKNGFYDKTTNPGGILPAKDLNGNDLTSFYTLEWGKPYVELSYGIENIFRFLRLDAIYRLTYLEHKDVKPFGIKATMVFRF